ncbi:MAG TPA: LamG-like jellyroll fold domain-containing protein [Capsulimonadaceae bacterium]|jgi:hypothetical protein
MTKHKPAMKLLSAITLMALFANTPAQADTRSFKHPGLLHNQADFDRMATKVKAGAHPWIDSWNILVANPHSQLSWKPRPAPVIYRGRNPYGENYALLYNDAAAAYQTALRWKVTGDTAYADNAVKILNAWGSTLTGIGGDSNGCLALGLYGYEIANAAEIMRSYSGWAPDDFKQFQTMLLKVFYAGNHDFLTRHNGTQPSHYWANWDLCNMCSMLAVGVVCDRPDIYDEAVTYFKHGVGAGNIDHTVYYMHPGYLGQWQESGRDQGHTTLGVALMGTFCEMAWKQGDDLYGYENNRVLAGMEYIAKYNLGEDVPYIPYANVDVVQPVIADGGRGLARSGWDLIYNHYVNLKGIAAPYSAKFAEKVRPEGGGGNYGPNSGGYDQLGFTTLTATVDPCGEISAPSGLTASVSGAVVTLSWWGTPGAKNYTIRRAAGKGPYETVGEVADNMFVDRKTVADANYSYKVVATLPSGKTLVSSPASVSLAASLIGRVKLDVASHSAVIDTATPKAQLASTGAAVIPAILNGTDQYVQLPPEVLAGVTDCTIAAWVKVNGHAVWQRIFDFGNGITSYMYLTPISGSGKPQFSITAGSGRGEEQIVGTSPFPIGAWTHVAVTLAAGTGTLYINGLPVGTNGAMLMTPSQLGVLSQAYIGKSQYPDPYFAGIIADFRLYRGSLNAKQIAELAAKAPAI